MMTTETENILKIINYFADLHAKWNRQIPRKIQITNTHSS